MHCYLSSFLFPSSRKQFNARVGLTSAVKPQILHITLFPFLPRTVQTYQIAFDTGIDCFLCWFCVCACAARCFLRLLSYHTSHPRLSPAFSSKILLSHSPHFYPRRPRPAPSLSRVPQIEIQSVNFFSPASCTTCQEFTAAALLLHDRRQTIRAEAYRSAPSRLPMCSMHPNKRVKPILPRHLSHAVPVTPHLIESSAQWMGLCKANHSLGVKRIRHIVSSAVMNCSSDPSLSHSLPGSREAQRSDKPNRLRSRLGQNMPVYLSPGLLNEGLTYPARRFGIAQYVGMEGRLGPTGRLV
ncbi:hypothetical protein BKA65DRAFT_33576 [Rhexocercosporidium sp. MPI-PUGE-AT-0058]|nr:hypothetical protein BKA65DRAFT_33576 [Rhexocercosporidium sp. MPI-PUGE-AT-0058]